MLRNSLYRVKLSPVPVPASRIKTLRPALANLLATIEPMMPPPTITTRGSFSSAITIISRDCVRSQQFYLQMANGRHQRCMRRIKGFVLSPVLPLRTKLTAPDLSGRDPSRFSQNVNRPAANPSSGAVSNYRSLRCSGFSASLRFARWPDLARHTMRK